ncbi:tetratricopeptide repeat protein [Candidatus Sumerlaeota bacterium]|nr:tetratricopeptide repeat protein [Candidatus Sumerlaeota bacterium]
MNQVLEHLTPVKVLEYIDYRTDTIQEISGVVRAFCPVHRETVFRTLSIENGSFLCKYNLCPAAEGGDLIQLVAITKEVDYDDALRLIVEEFGIDVALPPPAEYIETTLEVAENLLELSVLEESEQEYKKVLAIEPDNIRALEGMLEIHRERGETTRLSEILRSTLAHYMKQGDEKDAVDKALHMAHELLDHQPNDFDTRHQMAECLIRVGRYEEATNELMELADMFETKGEYERAVKIYERLKSVNYAAVDVEPHLVNALASQGDTTAAVEEARNMAADALRAKNYSIALDCYRQALEIDGSRSALRDEMLRTALEAGLNESRLQDCLMMAKHYLDKESPAAAEEIVNSLKNRLPDEPNVLRMEIRMLRQTGQDDQANLRTAELANIYVNSNRTLKAARLIRDAFNYVVKSDVSAPEAALSQMAATAAKIGEHRLAMRILLFQIDVLRRKQDIKQVATVYDQLIQMAPERPEFIIGAMQAFLEINEKQSAMKYSERLVACYETARDWVPLADALRQGLSLDDSRFEWHYKFACVLDDLDQKDEAIEHYLKAAEGFLENGSLSTAHQAVDAVLRWQPRHIEALSLAADVYLSAEQPQKALEALRSLAATLIERQEHPRAMETLERIKQCEKDAAQYLELYVELYRSMGEIGKLCSALRQLAEEFARREAYPRAVECITEALDQSPEDEEAILQLIQIFEATDKIDSANEMRLRLGDIYHGHEQFDKEIALYRKALEIQPDAMPLNKRLVQALVDTHRVEEAAKAAEQLIGRFAQTPHAAGAVQAVQSVLENDADNIELQSKLCDLYASKGMMQEWKRQCMQLAACYERRNMLVELAEVYEQLTASEPANADYRLKLIEVYRSLNRKDDEQLQQLELASQYADRGNLNDAAQSLKAILELDPENEEAMERFDAILAKNAGPEERIANLSRLAETCRAHGKPEAAVDVLRRIVALDPANTAAREKIIGLSKEQQVADQQVNEYIDLAQEQLRQQQPESALENFRRALELHSEHEEARRQMVKVLLQLERKQEALEQLWKLADQYNAADKHDDLLRVLNEMLRLDAQNIEARQLKAETYAKTGREKEALEEFMRISGETKDAGKPITPLAGIRRERTPSAGSEYNLEQAFESMPVVPEYTFKNFIISDNNNFAKSTCEAVAKAPAKHYNPVFLWSDVGLGKTHLINAIANFIQEQNPSLRIHYTNAEDFTGQLVDAISHNSLTLVRNYYKQIDVLLVDDVHFLAGKQKAQEEFFYIFNMLFQAKKQIVVTCDRPPKDIEHLEKRLKTRFGAGVIVDIQTPDLETRIAILQKSAMSFPGVAIDKWVFEKIAGALENNVRELKGAFNQTMAICTSSGQPPSEDLVDRIIAQFGDSGA